MLRVKGLECLVSLLKCMVEWSRDHYIDPATTGLNTVRVIRGAEKGGAPETLGVNEPESVSGTEAVSRHGSMSLGKHGTGTGGEGEEFRVKRVEEFESRKQKKEKMQQGIQL